MWGWGHNKCHFEPCCRLPWYHLLILIFANLIKQSLPWVEPNKSLHFHNGLSLNSTRTRSIHLQSSHPICTRSVLILLRQPCPCPSCQVVQLPSCWQTAICRTSSGGYSYCAHKEGLAVVPGIWAPNAPLAPQRQTVPSRSHPCRPADICHSQTSELLSHHSL